MIKGFKVFNSDWTCRPNGIPFHYTVGKTYEEDVKPEICKHGFHFCKKAVDCLNYYQFDPENKVAEVLALGEIDSLGDKFCTNKIKIVREIPWAEVLEMVNTGVDCYGLGNTGHHNSGHYNSGNFNSGHFNSGDCNVGWHNGGCYNMGDYNSGLFNKGNRNIGKYNTGNCNNGDWNECDYSNGCFNTQSQKIYMFNKPSPWTYTDWCHSAAYHLMSTIRRGAPEYIWLSDMTDEEKAEHPEAEVTGGYLNLLDNSEYAIIWWKGLKDYQKEVITSLPNFDKEIFKQITGIDIDKKY